MFTLTVSGKQVDHIICKAVYIKLRDIWVFYNIYVGINKCR
nr:MAG TPA: hypothetical protein [Caudoviricetes sp.]